MKIKKNFYLLFLMTLTLLLVACSGTDEDSNESSEEVHKIRFAHVLSEETPLHLSALDFKKNVEEKSDGRIEVEIFPNGQLFDSERETIEAIQIGNIEMSEVATAVVSGFESKFSVFNLPFLFDSREDAYSNLDGELGEELNSLLPEMDIVGLGYGVNGFRHFLNTKKPIEKPEDFSGLSIRVIENKMYEDLFNSLGANASPMGFGETYTALQQGVFDGLDSEINVASTAKLDEVTDYLTLSEHTFTATISMINQSFFEKLPDDLQVIVEEEGHKMNELERKLNEEQEGDRLEGLKENMEVNELTSEQKEVFREELQPIFDKYADEIGRDLVELAE